MAAVIINFYFFFGRKIANRSIIWCYYVFKSRWGAQKMYKACTNGGQIMNWEFTANVQVLKSGKTLLWFYFGNFIAQDNFWPKTSEFEGDKSGFSGFFQNSPNFEEPKNKFSLNRFLKVRIYFEAMDLNRSFLES